MSNELTLFSEASIEASDSPKQITFNWDETFAETKELVKEDAELTATIDDAMVKRFHGRVKIGFNLMALQREHSRKGGGTGDFTTVELPKLGITDRKFAYRCINVAKLFQNTNVPHGVHSELFDLPLPIRTWENLASPSSQTVVKQLESGEIEPTQEAIKKALQDAKNEAGRGKTTNNVGVRAYGRARNKLLIRDIRLIGLTFTWISRIITKVNTEVSYDA